MVTGKVQDIGFRGLIEDIARLHDLRGFAFNDVDGSVKMVCCGGDSVIDEFLGELKFRGMQKGTVIDEILKEEITSRVFLPQKFLRLYTDELADIGRKLDKGNEELIKVNVNLVSMDKNIVSMDKNIVSMDEKLRTINGGIGDLNTTMNSFVVEQREHNKRLDKILEKLAER